VAHARVLGGRDEDVQEGRHHARARRPEATAVDRNLGNLATTAWGGEQLGETLEWQLALARCPKMFCGSRQVMQIYVTWGQNLGLP
jgi:hypothetical protein